MNAIFPCYTTSFSCNCSMQSTAKRIMEMVVCKNNNLKFIKAYYTDTQSIILSSSTGGYVYYNSFMPLVNIRLRNKDGKTQVSVLFELHKSTKVLLTLYYMIALFFGISVLVLSIMYQPISRGLLFAPFGMVIITYVFSFIGLYFSSKTVTRNLFMSLNREDTKYIPSIRKNKYND